MIISLTLVVFFASVLILPTPYSIYQDRVAEQRKQEALGIISNAGFIVHQSERSAIPDNANYLPTTHLRTAFGTVALNNFLNIAHDLNIKTIEYFMLKDSNNYHFLWLFFTSGSNSTVSILMME